jgi:uncharacterized protein (TIGR00725 family)
VVGGKECNSDEYKIARQVGRLIAKAGAILICGGRGGVMEAACQGAVEEKGLTVGILPSDNINEANRFVKIPIATGMGIGRNVIIANTAQALIAISGQYGTLSEIAFALQMGKPVIALKPWLNVPGIQLVSNPEQAVQLALKTLP